MINDTDGVKTLLLNFYIYFSLHFYYIIMNQDGLVINCRSFCHYYYHFAYSNHHDSNDMGNNHNVIIVTLTIMKVKDISPYSQ